ncbi:UDP-N-acetylmuramate--L-alanyl-gamma-D-glutamyl-meso-2,6-diaminoheptandioate ligase [Bacterioplanes sanyensis]|uniref:UDP-N-acetylmuramate:L-alanyl-gamma-D-glutamyl- meso-diaminopimelate ligase n=1 Tax=Bacterioplanes sanyensis TaxID=1249553 RepID=UPI00167A8B30|nr:UDP-N-acetylmuramate:L-alanyl-gamma-D-glutamyl-meso-diaminopimelate ligase [Bacterioplanes sanyensis]GGY48361.1 UDP-N-acetylmuramate--L-alanyl-gamma-D-glutamyl-meso-2,6-diaminoheptandioate ligase [Bacterioplanes sanyensis]
MRVHILGICGTFMGSLAQLAKAAGHDVSGSDAGVYPPMSDQLQAAGIELFEGWSPEHIPADVDQVIIGNALSRGNPAVEHVLERGIPYTSGPQWLNQHVLPQRWVLAVAGTHGKTTTSSMLAWILDHAGMAPGFLIGGVPENFGCSARLGDTPFFVIEADEYDTAFFDKRSKFVHYQPRTLVLNNLEFDHADIFADLAAIERQFHHVVRTVPASGQVIYRADEAALQRVLSQGLWSSSQAFGPASDWHWQLHAADGSDFDICHQGQAVARIRWSLKGLHNVSNAMAAVLAARHVGVAPELAAKALESFQSVKRRLQCLGDAAGVQIFDDFAHHPTAIASTLEGMAAALQPGQRLIAVLEPRSNTMKMGNHQAALANAVAAADHVYWLQPEGLSWSLAELAAQHGHICCHSTDALLQALLAQLQPGDQVVCMSNGSFEQLPQRLLEQLQQQETSA